MGRYAAVRLLLLLLALLGAFGSALQLAPYPSRLRATLGRLPGADFNFSPDGKMLVAQDLEEDERRVRLWDTATGEEEFLSVPDLSKVGGVAWAPNSRFLVLADEEGGLRLWD